MLKDRTLLCISCCIYVINHLSRLTYGRARTKGSNPVVTQNFRISTVHGSREKDFQTWYMYFCKFVIISSWKRAWHFIWIYLNSLHPKMLCAMFGWNWPSGSGEEDFQNSSMYLRFFVIIFPWKKAWPFISINNESPSQPSAESAKYALCQVWLKLAQWFRRRSEKLTWAFSSGELKMIKWI